MARYFAVSAYVEEKALWDILMLLEHSRSTNIVSRPLSMNMFTEDAASSVPQLPAPDKTGHTGNIPRARAAILALIEESDDPFTVTDVLAREPNTRRHSVMQVLYQFKKKGTLKHVGKGTYARARKRRRPKEEAAAPASDQGAAHRTNGNGRPREAGSAVGRARDVIVERMQLNDNPMSAAVLAADNPHIGRQTFSNALHSLKTVGVLVTVGVGKYAPNNAPRS